MYGALFVFTAAAFICLAGALHVVWSDWKANR